VRHSNRAPLMSQNGDGPAVLLPLTGFDRGFESTVSVFCDMAACSSLVASHYWHRYGQEHTAIVRPLLHVGFGPILLQKSPPACPMGKNGQ